MMDSILGQGGMLWSRGRRAFFSFFSPKSNDYIDSILMSR